MLDVWLSVPLDKEGNTGAPVPRMDGVFRGTRVCSICFAISQLFDTLVIELGKVLSQTPVVAGVFLVLDGIEFVVFIVVGSNNGRSYHSNGIEYRFGKVLSILVLYYHIFSNVVMITWSFSYSSAGSTL